MGQERNIFKGFLVSLGVFLLVSCESIKETPQIAWVFVEGGEFQQGEHQFIISPGGDTIHGFTSPYRKVVLNDFYISKYEITVGQFKEFCKRTGRKMPEAPIENAHGKKVFYQWIDDRPMLATWFEARAYAEWVGGRLPTEAEWEFAAKGGLKSKGFRYSGSNDAAEVGWVAENSDSTFHKVGMRKPNELGIYDMTGNVNEWVSDWYNPDLDAKVSTKDPQGPREGEDKIAKGVSWFYETRDDNGAILEYGIHMPEVRYQSPPETRNDGFGFRIAKDK